MADPKQDVLSSEDLVALLHTQQALEKSGDPRADKLRQYISAQGHATLAAGEQEDPTLWSNPKAFLENRAASLQKEAQHQQDQYLGIEGMRDTEKAQGVVGKGLSYAKRFGHGVASVVPEAAALVDKSAAGLMDWKNAAVVASGAVDPALPAAYFGTDAIADLTGIGGRKSSVKTAIDNPTPENVQAPLLSGATVAGGASVANAPRAGVVPAAAKDAFQKGGQALSERMYQSALKPPPGSYSTPEVKTMVRTGLENEIPVSAAGAEKLTGLIKDLQTEVRGKIAAGNAAGETINKYSVAQRTGDTMKRFGTQASPTADLDAIRNTTQDFLDTKPNEIPVADAQAIKTGTYQQIKSRGYGEVKSATTETEKALARGLKEELETRFPEIKGLNAQEAKMYGLDEALERAVRRIDNRDLLSLGGKVATVGAGAFAGMEAGSAAAGAVAGIVMHEVMTNPMLQSKLAISLNKASRGKVTYAVAKSKVAAYVSALAGATNSANADTNAGQATPSPN